jgi:hypothetical protein
VRESESAVGGWLWEVEQSGKSTRHREARSKVAVIKRGEKQRPAARDGSSRGRDRDRQAGRQDSKSSL